MKFERVKTDNELTGKKHTVEYRGDNYYFSLFPGEVFISGVHEKDQKTAANLDIISRLLSMALMAYEHEDVLGQLQKASRSKKDIPGILLALLGEEDMTNSWV